MAGTASRRELNACRVRVGLALGAIRAGCTSARLALGYGSTSIGGTRTRAERSCSCALKRAGLVCRGLATPPGLADPDVWEALLTKHYVLGRLIDEICLAFTRDDPRAGDGPLGRTHKELADDLFAYDNRGCLQDSKLLQVCRRRDPEALRVVWVSLVAADDRRQSVLAAMSQGDGRLNEDLYATSVIEVSSRNRPAYRAASLLRIWRTISNKHESSYRSLLATQSSAPCGPRIRRALSRYASNHLAGFFGWIDPLDDAVELGGQATSHILYRLFKRRSNRADIADARSVGGPGCGRCVPPRCLQGTPGQR